MSHLVEVPEQQRALLAHSLDLREVVVLERALSVADADHERLQQRDGDVQGHQADAGAWNVNEGATLSNPALQRCIFLEKGIPY